MSDIYDFNRALNREAELILVADGHTPACDIDGNVIRSGFQMGLDPKTTPDSPRVMVMFLHPHLLSDEEVERAEESPEAREEVLVERGRRHQVDAERLLPAYAECLTAAGWEAEVSREGGFVRTVPPRAVVVAACGRLLRLGAERTMSVALDNSGARFTPTRPLKPHYPGEEPTP